MNFLRVLLRVFATSRSPRLLSTRPKIAEFHLLGESIDMLTTLPTDRLGSSVLAVPPLARNADYSLNEAENTKLIRHIEGGGTRTLLYGGNANFYHIALSEYD